MDAAEPVAPQEPRPQTTEEDKPDEAQATRFLEFLFGGVTQGFVEVRYLGAGPRPKLVGKPLFISLPLDRTRAAEIIPADDTPRSASVGAAPRYRVPRGGRAGKDQDVLQAGCVWADLGYGSFEGGAIGVGRTVRAFPLRPSITVNSGYGRQVYFVLNKALSDGKLLDWDELARGVAEALGGAEDIDVSRTLPLPGSLHLENPQNPLICRIDEDDSSWVRYSVEELRDAVRNACELRRGSPGGTRPGADQALSPPATLQERGVAAEVISAITTGRLPRPGTTPFVESRDYHERDLWIAMSLLDSGFDKDEVKSVFRSNPNGCGSKFAREKHGERYLEFTLRTAVALRRRQGHYDSSEDDSLEYVELPAGYELDRDGSLWFRPQPEDGWGKTPKHVKVSNSYIGIGTIHENIDTGQISLAIEYEYLGQSRVRVITRSQMSDARQLVTTLAGEGAPVTSNNARHVTAYLAAFEHAFGAGLPRRRITSRFGRGSRCGAFFLPGAVSDVDFTSEGDGSASLFRAYASRRGTLQGWLDMTRTLAEEKLLIPQVAILACLVPPLQRMLRIPNFILDIHGSTSTGKSTSLKLAASVYGSFVDPDSMVMQWMNTQVAVEQLAGTCSELPVFLDDAQHCPDELKRSVVYMIANGRGKGRAARGRGLDEVTTWHTVALSTSEEALHESSPHEGARGRILPVGGATPPFPPGASSLVRSLERSAAINHGFAGEAYIRHLNNWTDSDWSRWLRRYSEICKELLRGSPSNVTDRVSGYVASIQLAAEIACPLLGIPFKPDVISAGLMLHLIDEQSNRNLVLLALRELADFYITNNNHFAGDGGYSSDKPVALFGVGRRHLYVGFLRRTLEAIFKARKWSQVALLNKMAELGVLHVTEGDRHTSKVAIEGIKHRMICIKWSALLPADADHPGDRKAPASSQT
jgi:hypothetical protein